MQYVDYYKALGVDRDASKEEISRAYKRAARKCHPDLNKDPGAEDRFKEITVPEKLTSTQQRLFAELRDTSDALGG